MSVNAGIDYIDAKFNLTTEPSNAVFREYTKRFANGEQDISIGVDGKILKESGYYYWKHSRVFNKIPEMIAIWEESVGTTLKKRAVATKLYGKRGLVAQLIPIQKAYNNVMNLKEDLIERIAYGTILVEDGSVDVDSLEEEGLAPGKVLVYRQGANPPQGFPVVSGREELVFIDSFIEKLEQMFVSIALNMK